DAHELAPDLPAVAAARAATARRQVEAALHEDDLLAAAAAVPALASDAAGLARQVARRVGERRAARRRTVGAIAVAALLAVAGLAGLVAVAVDGSGRAARAAAERQRAAAALLAAAPEGGDAVAARARLLAALQAQGLAPGDAAAAAMAASAAAVLVESALADGEFERAERHADTVRRFGGPDPAPRITAARAERSVAEQAERGRQRDRLTALTGPGRGGVGTEWLERAATEIAGWPGTLAGIGLERLAEGDPIERQLLARVLAIRPGAMPASAAIRLASDPLLPPALAADLATATADPWPLLQAMDPWRARAIARRNALPAPAQDSATAAWIRADGAALARLAAAGDARILLAAAALRWYQDQDLAGARTLADRAALADPLLAAPWQAELAWFAGEAPAASDDPGTAPWRALALVGAGRHAEARTLLRAASAACAAPWHRRWAAAAERAGDAILATRFAESVASDLPDLFALQGSGLPEPWVCADLLERHGPHPLVMAAGAEALAAAGRTASAAVLVAAAALAAPEAARPVLVRIRLLGAAGASAAALAASEDLIARVPGMSEGAVAADGWGDHGRIRAAAADAALAAVPAADPVLSLRAARSRLAMAPERETRALLAARARAVDALLALGDGDGAAALLLERRTGDDAGIRAGLDALCLASPALRRSGWPGCHGRALALRCARAALGAARHGGDPSPWLADAARHGAVAPLDRLALALAGGDRVAAAAVVDGLPGDLPAEPWLAALLPGLRAWCAGGALPDLPPPPRDGTGPGRRGQELLDRWRERAGEWSRFAPVPGDGGDDGRVAAAFAGAVP
ncbi:MAG: hypothetical protein RLZZ127_601, partial [Planctomycetota bacterium]